MHQNKRRTELTGKTIFSVTVEFRWGKGHAGNKGNERADSLALPASTEDPPATDKGSEVQKRL